MKKILIMCLLSLSLMAAETNVFKASYKAPIDKVMQNIRDKFKADMLIIVWELDILEEFKTRGLVQKLGAEYNKAGVTAVKTFVACNGMIGNSIINADADMMAYCPVRITLTEKDGVTSVLYVRPTSAPRDSKAYPALVKLENKVVAAIQGSMEME
ncbi:DUF302 domain-containing protein [Sulfurimonas sp.]|uniref:DUF302 domain-containing protein n=1 Tax=Sulfurimonas sp. TaxID=2022749 RepID=UPI003D0AF89A